MPDPKTIWQSQPTDPSLMTLETIRLKTRALRSKTLLGVTVPLVILFLCGYAIAWVDGPVVRAMFALAIVWSLVGQYFLHRGMWSRTGDAGSSAGIFLWWFLVLVILALIAVTVPVLIPRIRNGTLVKMIPFLVLLALWIVGVSVRRIMTMPGDTALSTGLESYRREVERRRALSGRFLWWFLAPVVLALAAFTVPVISVGIRTGTLVRMIPFLVLLALWIVGVCVRRIMDRWELRREIDQLNEIERTNGL
ncbi:MAG: hypothetical protein ABSF22_01805 [Bryobacteraceae bacterium]